MGSDCGGYGDLFHLGCLWTLVLIGVGGGGVMYGGFICKLAVICSSLDSRSSISIVVFLWCMQSICRASVSVHGSLLSTRDIVGSVYIMMSGVKCMMTCVSSNIILYGVSFVVHSFFGMVRIVIVSWFSFAARRASVCFICCVGGHINYLAICV